jgi:hypothetical protein
MRDVSTRIFETSLSGGSMRRVRRKVRLAMGDECSVHMRLMTTGRMSTSVPSKCWRIAFARGVYLSRIISDVCERFWSLQCFHSPI